MPEYKAGLTQPSQSDQEKMGEAGAVLHRVMCCCGKCSDFSGPGTGHLSVTSSLPKGPYQQQCNEAENMSDLILIPKVIGEFDNHSVTPCCCYGPGPDL